jgi:hypothetical protein
VAVVVTVLEAVVVAVTVRITWRVLAVHPLSATTSVTAISRPERTANTGSGVTRL